MKANWIGFLLAVTALEGFASATEVQSTPVSRSDYSSGGHLGISTGVGLANELVGFQIHARYRHIGLTGELGLGGVGGGVRYFFLPDGHGVFLSMHCSWTPATEVSFFHVATTVNYRWKWGRVFFEAGIGPAAVLTRAYLVDDSQHGKKTLVTKWNWGILGDVRDTNFFPDIHLAVGVEF